MWSAWYTFPSSRTAPTSRRRSRRWEIAPRRSSTAAPAAHAAVSHGKSTSPTAAGGETPSGAVTT